MKCKILIIGLLLLCFIGTDPAGMSSARADEVFLITADQNGNNYYMGHLGEGIFSAPWALGNTGMVAYGNAIADFDNDGDYDYIVTRGFYGGEIMLFEKLGPGPDFAAPQAIGTLNDGAFYAGQMVVADFVGEDHLDFVQTYYDISDCQLFQGDGELGFSEFLAGSGGQAPAYSGAADSADFDNDGHADFIVASSAGAGEFFLNLGDGRGNFDTLVFGTYYGNFYTGVVAGDFNGDGAMDLAAATSGAIDIYMGDPEADWEAGGVHLAYSHSIGDSNIGSSTLDNYDFIGDDGIQDLVVAGYGSSNDQIAVFRGDGNGRFGGCDGGLGPCKVNQSGGSAISVITVAAPPVPEVTEVPNQEPVAVIEPTELVISAGETAEFFATGSYDPDGEIESYQWDFGDGRVVNSLTSTFVVEDITPTFVYHEAGDYSVTLTVTDALGATNTATAVVQVSAVPVPATVVFYPRTLNLNRKGNWIRARIKLPDGYDLCGGGPVGLSMVDAETRATIATAVLGKCRGRHKKFMARFNRQAVIDHIAVPTEEAVLQIKGKIYYNGGLVDFSGAGSIRAEKPEKKSRKYWHSKRWAGWKANLRKVCKTKKH